MPTRQRLSMWATSQDTQGKITGAWVILVCIPVIFSLALLTFFSPTGINLPKIFYSEVIGSSLFRMTDIIDLSQMTSADFTKVPAGFPPPRVIVGYRNITPTSSLKGTMITVVALELYVILRIKKRMEADNGQFMVGVIGTCFDSIISCSGVVKYIRITRFGTVWASAVTKAKLGTHLYNLSVARAHKNKGRGVSATTSLLLRPSS